MFWHGIYKPSKKDINQIINEWVIHAQKSQVREPYHIAKYLPVSLIALRARYPLTLIALRAEYLLTLLHSEQSIC